MVFLSVSEVSNRTGVRTDTIYLLIKSGKVESQRVGPKRLVSIAESDLHLIENRKTNNRVSGSDFGKDLFTAHEVAELTGVDVARLCELIRAGVVARADIGRARPTLIHKRELPAIAAISAVPGPGDPTQDEIRQLCAEVQLARLDVCPHETRRRRALQLFDRTSMVNVRDASERLGCSAQVAALALAELEVAGRVEIVSEHPLTYGLPESTADQYGIESADSVLNRFRERAIEQTNKRRRVAIAA